MAIVQRTPNPFNAPLVNNSFSGVWAGQLGDGVGASSLCSQSMCLERLD